MCQIKVSFDKLMNSIYNSSNNYGESGVPPLKRLLIFLLIATMAAGLVGCSKSADPGNAMAASVDATDAPTSDAPLDFGDVSTDSDSSPADLSGAPSPDAATIDQTGAPSAADATPAPTLALADYQYEVADSTDLGMSFKYPSTWINVPGTYTLCYAEPTDPGVVGAQISVTRADVPQGVIVTELVGVDRLVSFAKDISTRVQNYKKVSNGRIKKIAGNTGFQITYTAELNGTPIKGFCALAYNKKNKAKKNTFYLLHFYCPADQFKDFGKVLSTIEKSLKI